MGVAPRPRLHKDLIMTLLSAVLSSAKVLAHGAGRRYIQTLCRAEAKNQKVGRLNERGVEYEFVFRFVAQCRPRSVLDVGTGATALPSLLRTCGPTVRAIDNVSDYWPNGMLNRHYHVEDEDICQGAVGTYDMITCVSVLEHIRDPTSAIRSMLKALNTGGSLIVTFPYSELRYIPNVYDLPNSAYGKGEPYVCQSYSREDLKRWFASCQITDQEYWKFWDGEFWTCGKMLPFPIQSSVNEPHQLTCLRAVRS